MISLLLTQQCNHTKQLSSTEEIDEQPCVSKQRNHFFVHVLKMRQRVECSSPRAWCAVGNLQVTWPPLPVHTYLCTHVFLHKTACFHSPPFHLLVLIQCPDTSLVAASVCPGGYHNVTPFLLDIRRVSIPTVLWEPLAPPSVCTVWGGLTPFLVPGVATHPRDGHSNDFIPLDTVWLRRGRVPQASPVRLKHGAFVWTAWRREFSFHWDCQQEHNGDRTQLPNPTAWRHAVWMWGQRKETE